MTPHSPYDNDVPMVDFGGSTDSLDRAGSESPVPLFPTNGKEKKVKRPPKEHRKRTPLSQIVIPLQLIAIPILCCSAMLMVVNLAPGVPRDGYALMYSNPPLEIFACVGQTVIFLWTFAVSARIWRRTPDLREETIFPGLPVYSVLLCRLLLRTSVIFFVLTSIYIGIFTKKPTDDDKDGLVSITVPFAPVWAEAFIFFTCFFYMICPWSPGWRMRKGFFKTLLECFVTGFGKPFLTKGIVEFKHNMLANAITSATSPLWQFIWAFIHFYEAKWFETTISEKIVSNPCLSYTSLWGKPVVYIFPFWVRMIQCIWLYIQNKRRNVKGWDRTQHLVNATKYLVSIICIILTAGSRLQDNYFPEQTPDAIWGGWRGGIILAFVIKTIFSFSWDIYMSWGLLKRNSRYWLLRPVLIFGTPVPYYMGMVLNFLLRCSWTGSLHLRCCFGSCSILFSLLEILRRGMWFIFRVEYQYVRIMPYDEHESDGEEDAESIDSEVDEAEFNCTFDLRKRQYHYDNFKMIVF